MPRRSFVSSLLALGLTFAPALASAGEGAECAQGKLSLQSVVDKHLQAMGGKARLKAAKTYQFTVVATEGSTVTTTNVRRARPNLMRHDTDKNGTSFTKMFDGNQGWTVEGSAAPQRLDKEKNTALAEGAHFDDALLDPKAQGVSLAMDGADDVNGTPTFKLVLTRGTTTQVRFIDQKSFLEVRRTYAGIHEGKAYNKAITFSDFRSVDGIMVSHRVKWEGDGQQGEKVIQGARYDAPIEASVFKLLPPRS
ncbi:hypothetical protein HUA78_15560 [Myxococcus sp. CA033]|uniref:hypothetical protein n=1 Tax=Myxococcus sp. CA033 TaxID=2741516 RepID=UPI00157A9E7D|nr:hypothetical protein [Myxococcus sp. CA033]NTX35865.1 hypothetical protein [Myxococcus sp. CA033]